MSKKSILLSGLYAVMVVSIAAVVIVSTEIAIPEPPKLTTPVDLEPVPSENCIACHTDEDIITIFASGERDGGHGGEGG